LTESLLSSSWYRVARLRPRIRANVRFHRHRYRGQTWWVLQDRTTGRSHRLSEAAYGLAGLMDGSRTTHALWEAVCARFGDDAPTQDETIRLLGMLDLANALESDVTPNTREFLRRRQRREDAEWWRRYANPLSIRVPLWDPQAFLVRNERLVGPLFSRPGLVVMAAVVALAALLAVVHAGALAAATRAWVSEPTHWLMLALLYPLVKAVHELGHAFATRRFGGEVHEMGILFLALMPLPYVDASAASVFPDRAQRALVGAAGIIVEGVLAALAFFVWLNVASGWMSSAALAVMLVGGTSTLLFNGNPLLRYDGYYVLADLLDIPNLYSRSRQYLVYLAQKKLLGLSQVRRPVTESGEPVWLLLYGVASWAYRVAIGMAIALFFSRHFFVLGVLLAVFVVVSQLLVPLVRMVDFLLSAPQVSGRRGRTHLRAAGLAALLLGGLFALPVPLGTRAQGVVWPAERAQVRAAADGFVVRLLARPGDRVEAGQPLIETDDPTLHAELGIARARVEELEARLQASRYTDRAAAESTSRELETARAALERTRERSGERIVRAAANGTFAIEGGADWTGRYVRKGALLGYVLGEETRQVRVVVSQDDVARVREETREVQVRTVSRPGRVHPARIQADVPSAVSELPARSLGSVGGGPWASDPDDGEGLRIREPAFVFDLELPQGRLHGAIGERVYVRFDHGNEPVVFRAMRALRGLFLRRQDA
jgi:putative peptide zinc metalloprotease protein